VVEILGLDMCTSTPHARLAPKLQDWAAIGKPREVCGIQNWGPSWVWGWNYCMKLASDAAATSRGRVWDVWVREGRLFRHHELALKTV
jgi:hypothetical protein